MRPEFQDIVDEVSRLLERPATLEDRDFNLVAFCSHEAQVDEVRLRSIMQRHSTREVQDWFEQFGIATSEVPVRTPASADLEVLSRLCLPVRWHGVTYGYLWLLDEHGDDRRGAPVPEAAALAERAGALMAQQARSREELDYTVEDLLSTDPEAAGRPRRAIHELGIVGRDVPVAAVELRLVDGGPGAAGADEPVAAAQVGARCERRGAQHPPGAGRHGRAGRGPRHRATGVGPVRRAPPACATARAWSSASVASAPTSPRRGTAGSRHGWRSRSSEAVESMRPIAVWPELGVYRLLACGPDKALASAVLDPAVRRLLGQNDPELRHTALAFLEAGGNVQETAAALHVHRQTVYYRVQKIEQVTGLTLVPRRSPAGVAPRPDTGAVRGGPRPGDA